MTAAPRHVSYHLEGFDEACLCFGDANAARRIMIVPPLFDEMNRVRAILVGAMRALADRNVMSLLPDIPGCNESLAAMTSQSVERWCAAMAAAAKQLGATHVAAVRGGALLVAEIALPRWQLSPVKGASLVKTMLRTRIASDKESGRTSTIESLMAETMSGPIELSGYLLGAEMLSGLNAAVPNNNMVESTLGDGPGQIVGKPLWLRAEPQEDAAMSAALAAELDRWSASCGG